MGAAAGRRKKKKKLSIKAVFKRNARKFIIDFLIALTFEALFDFG
jgi:hypothetical protein